MGFIAKKERNSVRKFLLSFAKTNKKKKRKKKRKIRIDMSNTNLYKYTDVKIELRRLRARIYGRIGDLHFKVDSICSDEIYDRMSI
jgi:hypothetical protein